MTGIMDRRLSRLEGASRWGTAADLTASRVLVMRVPPGVDADRRVGEAQARAISEGKVLKVTASALAAALPLWRLVPVDLVPDDLLAEFITETQARVDMLESLQ